MNDAFDRAWELIKAFPNMEYWHGTTADAARQILEEGLEAWSFGADDPDDPEMYSLDRMEARNEAPAMLAFDTTPEHTIHDPKEQGYDIGSEYGHWLIEEPVSPENVRLFAMGSKDMDGDEWIRFLDMLRAADRLSYRYPDIDEAYANRAVQKAWELIKAPFEINHPNMGKIKTIDRAPLYSGGDRIHDDFKYWTEDMDEALAYALYGSAVPSVDVSDLENEIPMRETYPAIKVMENPSDEYIPLMQDPQSQGYIDEFDEMGGEFMDEDELYAWIASMLPDYDLPPNEEKAAWKQWSYNDEGDEVAPRMVQPINPLGTTGWYHNDVARDEHMAGALNRLRDQMSGRIALPDDVLYQSKTAHTDYLDGLEYEALAGQWFLMDEAERQYIRRVNPEAAEMLDNPER